MSNLNEPVPDHGERGQQDGITPSTGQAGHEIDLGAQSITPPLTRPKRAGSAFGSIKAAAPDQILDLKQLYLADPNPEKIDLSAGVYQDAGGMATVMAVVQKAIQAIEAQRAASGPPADYVPIEGLKRFNQSVTDLLYGRDAGCIAEGRVATLQAVGGTSALRYGADFLKRFFPDSAVYLSDPSWPNHKTIFERAGIRTGSYPYFDAKELAIDFDAMTAKLASLPAGSIVLLQGCCHNPSGRDLSPEQWEKLVNLFTHSELVPFVDMAYHGFGSGLDADVVPLRRLAESGVSHFVACSFSKNFSLYDKRIGSLTFVGGSAEETTNVFSQIKTDIRANNSSPPREGAEIVATILEDPVMRAEWETELAGMRQRIETMRERFIAAMEAEGLADEVAHMREERGMFSLTGLGAEKIRELREKHSIYMLENGRLCFACLNDDNLGKIAKLFADAMR